MNVTGAPTAVTEAPAARLPDATDVLARYFHPDRDLVDALAELLRAEGATEIDIRALAYIIADEITARRARASSG